MRLENTNTLLRGVPATKYPDAATWIEMAKLYNNTQRRDLLMSITKIQIIVTFIHVHRQSLPMERCSVAAMAGNTGLLSPASSSY